LSFISEISDDDTSIEARQKGGNAQDLSGWVHDSFNIQREVPVRHVVPLRIIDGRCQGRRKIRVIDSGPNAKSSKAGLRKSSVFSDPSTSSASNGTCSCLNLYAGSYYLSSMTSDGYPIRTPILQSLVETSSSSSLGVSPDQDSIEYYPEIGATSARTLQSRLAISAWWVPLGCLLITAPINTQPSGDLKRPTPRHQAT
jgi:hypothetical protein